MSSVTPNSSSLGLGQWTKGAGGGGRVERNNTTHLHKQQAHTSLSPSGIHVDESFMLDRNHIMYNHG